jgi:cation:H+ antiporter
MLAFVDDLSSAVLAAIFVASAVAVWRAGTRLSHQVDRVGRSFGLGQAFAGMLLLGGITSLPELAATSTAAASGNAVLAVNNLLGSAAINILLLVVADLVLGRAALTRVAAKPGTLMQGVLCMMLLGTATAVILVGDVELAGVGIGVGTLFVAAAALAAIRISAAYEKRGAWAVVGDTSSPPRERGDEKDSPLRLIAVTALLGAIILVAGALLSITADALADRAQLSSGMVGFLLVAFATSLPELSSIVAAMRARNYELAVGDIFGTNLFNLLLLLPVDALSHGEPVLAATGTFEALGATIALLMTGAFVVGLLERGDRTLLRMGYDAVAALLVFLVGVALMNRFAG